MVWTNEEDKTLDELYADTPNAELARILNKSTGTISNRARVLFLRKRPYEYAYYKGDEHIITGTISEVAEYMGVNKTTVGYYASPAHKKRCGNSDNRTIVVRMGGYD